MVRWGTQSREHCGRRAKSATTTLPPPPGREGPPPALKPRNFRKHELYLRIQCTPASFTMFFGGASNGPARRPGERLGLRRDSILHGGDDSKHRLWGYSSERLDLNDAAFKARKNFGLLTIEKAFVKGVPSGPSKEGNGLYIPNACARPKPSPLKSDPVLHGINQTRPDWW